MFTEARRTGLRDALVAAAEGDPRVTAAALVGSAAVGREDRWSDIDLALAVAPDADIGRVVADWTAWMAAHGVVDRLDLPLGATLFRVFLLRDTLQVDLSFWPAAEFGATGPKWRLLFGAANEELPHVRPPRARDLVGRAWLHALHVRSSLARGRVWQAAHMIDGMREQVLALACLRHGLPAVQGRGVDDLPGEVTGPFAETLARSLAPDELRRAFAVTTRALLSEVALVDAALAARLDETLRRLGGLAPG
ncbi:nucleotidyltransferase domain-containing protein [Streptomyces sedi]|uniref:Nucleotidyltransferase domain-containing protein n=1 Tax=Streptomyces sedi TaxID=555059 RepID=A0A5C4UZX7_9ACTN|nr:nucleotidyltransferase domain-containing protein [Streptomyces sedi]TNM28796.1 nucleotidyltransferase domain-containing protein [Streptomyces sedi]